MKVKMRVLRPLKGQGQLIAKGSVIEVSEARARELERNKLAVPLAGKAAPEATNKMAPPAVNKARTGSLTGAETVASSSARVRAPRKPRSRKRGADAAR